MRDLILDLFLVWVLVLVLSGCGRSTSGACSAYAMDLTPNSPLAGTYHDTANNKKLVLGSDCSFVLTTITATSQLATGTWSQPISGNIPFVVNSTNGGAFAPSTTGSMGVGYSGSPFTMQHANFTGGFTLNYVKQ